jgi:hypothetical protein
VLQGQELVTSNMMVRPARRITEEQKWLSSPWDRIGSVAGLPDGGPETRCSVVESPSELVGW